ncbi:MAG TPA: ABC transporter substrate binding protein [Rhodocyclaceae bacterium]|nr:ABC transporter substrate binding protein [Rhodocyclaceae bacterium]
MRLRALLLALMLAGHAVAGHAETVWIAVSAGSPDYATVAETVRDQLQQSDPTVDAIIKPWADVTQQVLPPQVKLVVSIGTPALTGLADASAGGRLGRVPVIATTIPSSAFEAQRKRIAQPLIAVVLDQPPGRQMALLRYAFPTLSRIGILIGTESAQYQAGLEKAAADQGLQLNVYRVNGGEDALYPVLQRVLDENDMLLAVPDATIYNSASIQNILLASYRQKIPLIGYSPAYVRAGAMLALYSTPTQIGTQTARIVHGLLVGNPTGSSVSVQSPTDFSVGVNINVARSLGFRLSADALTIQLQGR